MAQQLSIPFDAPERQRLGRQCQMIAEIMRDGNFYTLDELQKALRSRETVATTPSISARIRDLRKQGYRIEVTSRIGTLYQYRIVTSK